MTPIYDIKNPIKRRVAFFLFPFTWLILFLLVVSIVWQPRNAIAMITGIFRACWYGRDTSYLDGFYARYPELNPKTAA